MNSFSYKFFGHEQVELVNPLFKVYLNPIPSHSYMKKKTKMCLKS